MSTFTTRLAGVGELLALAVTAFVVGWIGVGAVWDEVYPVHAHQVVPTAAVTGILAVPVGLLVGGVLAVLSRNQVPIGRVVARRSSPSILHVPVEDG